MSVSEKRSCIEPVRKTVSISRQCELIDLPRSGDYRADIQGESAENLELMRLIDEEYLRYPLLWGAEDSRLAYQAGSRCQSQTGAAFDAVDGYRLNCA